LKVVPQVAEVMEHVDQEEELIDKASNAAHRV
jgi:hypothetical protein